MGKIPKIIHYCWFGKNPKPKLIQNCIRSWHTFCPEYTIIEWNEENFDVDGSDYTKEAYRQKKYAFVSDVARVKALYKYGGIYLDTDVEVFKTFDEVLDNRCVLGFEQFNYIATSFMACERAHPLMKDFIALYHNLQFLNSDGSNNTGTNVVKLTTMLEADGLLLNNQWQLLSNGVKIYPQVYFSPLDYANCISQKTSTSICEHKFDMSWSYSKLGWRKLLKGICSRILGPNLVNWVRSKVKK